VIALLPFDCLHGLRRNAPNFLQKSVAIEDLFDSTRGRDKLRFHRGQGCTVLLADDIHFLDGMSRLTQEDGLFFV
jgi:hypothetical protein